MMQERHGLRAVDLEFKEVMGRKKAFPGRSRSCVVEGRDDSNNWISLSIEDMERDQEKGFRAQFLD